MIYRTMPFSTTLNYHYPQFQGHAITVLNISEMVRDTHFQWNTNRNLYTTYSLLSFEWRWVTLSGLVKYLMTRNIARSLAMPATAELFVLRHTVKCLMTRSITWSLYACDSWAFCFTTYSEMLNDTKHHVVSLCLRQLSFLFCCIHWNT